MTQLQAMSQRTDGLFALLRKHGRGVDTKMRVDAKVLILLNGDVKMGYSEVVQISGRGVRSQATPSSTVILTKQHTTTDVLAILKANEKVNAADAVDIVEQVYNNYDKVQDAQLKKLIREATVEEKWSSGLGSVSNDRTRQWLQGLDNNNN